MRDLVLLANRLIADFPEYYPMFSETEFKFDGRAPKNVTNRNPLLKLGIGADGLKTGHTSEAGYGLVGSAIQGERRVIFAISGLDTSSDRAEVSQQVVNWAFRQFAEKQLAEKGERIAEAEVWMGAAPSVGLVPQADVALLLPVLDQDEVQAEVIYHGPIEAPVTKGEAIAELILRPVGLPEFSVPLVAAEDVPAGGFGVRVGTAARVLMDQIGLGAGDQL